MDVPEELDVCIAQRAFDNAVELVERARVELDGVGYSNKTLVQTRAMLEEKTTQLTETLCAELDRAALRPHTIIATVLLILRLGEPEQVIIFLLSFFFFSFL